MSSHLLDQVFVKLMIPMQIVSSDQGESFAVVGDVYRFLATGETTNGQYAMWEALVLPGGGPPLHVHSREVEGFLVLDGEITFRAEERVVRTTKGTMLHMPIGVRHAFKNESSSPARLLIWVVPAGLERMFQETGVSVPHGTTTAPPISHEEIERLLAAAPRYGVTIFPPGT